MKNLFIYINPTRNFNKKWGILAKIQIDNSLDLGWKKEDILFVTNFPYKYNGIKSLVVGDENYCEVFPPSTKTTTILNLMKNGVIGKGIYWAHDLDAYQLVKITESEVGMNNVDMALTDYGRMPRWTGGSVFFKKSAQDIYQHMRNIIYKHNINEENALMSITRDNLRWTMRSRRARRRNPPIPTGIKGIESIKKRIKKLNITYNFTGLNLRPCFKMVIKPIKVAHFHPFEGIRQLGVKNSFEFFSGENKIVTPLITKRLIKIFNQHGIK
jgi:hypothetical protein